MAASPSAKPERAIELRSLRREFGERPVLHGVDFELGRGKTLAVLGPNGAGKTTLLRILAGLLRPSGGEARVLGAELPRESWRLRGRIGWLGHEPLLYRDLSARENLAFAARLYGLESGHAERRAEELLELVGLARRGSDRVRDYSRGMLQRVAICRAVLHEPELLLLDEPLSHLDVEARERVKALIGAGGERTRVLVSHDHEAAVAEADHVLRLAAGGAPLEAVAA
ncbi:MAG: ABC transporter ATP-binding protein [Solirubrobacterales bacterium]